jgi:cysteine desulfurase/selenocysteine lyase
MAAQAAGAEQLLDVRPDFPLLERLIDGRPIVYLDSAATSQKPAAVLAAMDAHYRLHNANPHRGVYTLAQEATDEYEGARARIAAFTGADPTATVFTRNVTEAINLVAHSWAREQLGPGDAVLLTKMEHHSNIVPWQLAAQHRGFKLRYLDFDADGALSLQQLEEELARGDVRLLSVAHVSNVLATINPVREMTELAHRAGALVLIDGAQAVPHLPVDVARLGADFYAWTGHKALGPTGVGVLHARRELLDSMPPFLGGGSMIGRVELESSTWAEVPWKFEAGTQTVAETVGLAAAVDYLDRLGMDRVRHHERRLTEQALAGLAQIDGVTIAGPPPTAERGGLISFDVDGMHPHDVAELLNRRNVCVRAGHHCAQPAMRELGVAATARASFGPYNVPSDVDALLDALREAIDVFAG